MADLGNRTNVDTAINLLLDDAQPNDAIQPSDHNGLLKNILDTLANGLSVTLRTNPETGGQDIEITSGDKLKYKSSTFFNSLVSATLTADRTLTFPDKTDTIATLTDVQNIMNTNGLTLGGNYTHDLNSNNLVFDDGSIRVTNGDLGVLGGFNAQHDGVGGLPIASFISSGGNPVLIVDNTNEALGIGTSGPQVSAILDIESTSKAVLFPRMTTTQRNAISTPIESMFIYNTTTDQFEFRSSGGTWDALGGGDSIYTASGTVPSSTVATITDSLTFAGGQIALSSTNDGILLNRVDDSQMTAISATTNEIVFNTDKNALYRWDGSAWVALASGFGIVSLNNSSGEPTFYADLQSAINVSSADDEISIHSDLTLSAQVSITKRLRIAMNGNTITLNSATTDNAIHINYVGSNGVFTFTGGGKIVRSGGSASAGNSLCVYRNTSDSLDFGSTQLVNDFGTCIYALGGGDVFNGQFWGEGLAVASTPANFYFANIYSNNSHGFYSNDNNTFISNSIINAPNGIGISGRASARYCEITSGSNGIDGCRNDAIGNTINAGGRGIDVGASNVNVENNIITSTGIGIYSSSLTQIIGNTVVSGSYAVFASTGTNIVSNPLLKSTGAICVFGSQYGDVINNVIITTSNNSAHHGITTNNPATHHILNNYIEVGNSGANAIVENNASTFVFFTGNTFKGMTTPLNLSNGNQQTNSEDSTGSILIG